MTLDGPGRRDLAVGLGLLAANLAWDAGGADLPVMRWLASAQGFAARDAWWAETLLHKGGLWSAWALALALLVAAFRAPARSLAAPSRVERLHWLGVALLIAVAVPAVKRLSTTSCPWDLAEFGGIARHVSHWRLGVVDGGPGHCFPAGHVAAAFAYLALYFQWREHRPRVAHAWLLAVSVVGVLFGIAQTARGAHYPSHTLWTAWLSWTICAIARPAVGLVTRPAVGRR